MEPGVLRTPANQIPAEGLLSGRAKHAGCVADAPYLVVFPLGNWIWAIFSARSWLG
jgi:hypothetical protein